MLPIIPRENPFFIQNFILYKFYIINILGQHSMTKQKRRRHKKGKINKNESLNLKGKKSITKQKSFIFLKLVLLV